MNYLYMQQQEQISKSICWVKEARHKIIHAEEFYLCKILEWAKFISIEIRARVAYEGRW